jgi:hypothetical protein
LPTLVGFMVQKTRKELNEIAEKFQTRNKSNMKSLLWFHNMGGQSHNEVASELSCNVTRDIPKPVRVQELESL